MTLTKEKIIEILKAHTEEMESYSYYGSNPGIPEDDYSEVADEILSIQASAQDDKSGGQNG